ncbi:MAG: c-type cytochrome, partial [Gemmataceae bacterium]
AGALNPKNTEDHTPTARSDRWVKIILLVASLVTLVFLVAAMVRENFLTDWRSHQRHYRQLLEKSDDERQRQLAQSFQIELRQIDLPQFNTVDRCVTCHVGIDNPAMAQQPNPYRYHHGDFLKWHPPEKYGCTVCHRGQGSATTFHEATAIEEYWDYPLLPVHLTQASCGACHAPDSPLMAKHAPKLAHGRQLFLDRGCQSCHKLGDVGGQLGPVLDNEGLKIKHQLPMAHVQGDRTLVNWLQQHFDNPQHIVPGSQMRPPRLTAAENEALTVYMISLQDRDWPKNYYPADQVAAWNRELHEKTTDPVILYNRFCVNCHGDGTYSQWDRFFNRFVPAIRGPGLRAVADSDYLRTAIDQGRPGTLMPAWNKQAGGLTAEQVDALVTYLKSGDGKSLQVLRPPPTALESGNANRGSELFIQHCAGCHSKLAPNLGNPVFQRSASNKFLALTIVNGRIDAAMPAFQGPGAAGLTDDEIRDVIAHIRSLRK